MYDPKKKLPEPYESVLIVIQMNDHQELCEGHIRPNGRWYPSKYGFNGWQEWNVIGWRYMPRLDEFSGRFLSFSIGFAVGVAFVLTVVLAMAGG